MAMIVPPPHFENFCENVLKSGKKLCQLFQLAQNVMARAAVARLLAIPPPPPPPSKHPGAAPV